MDDRSLVKSLRSMASLLKTGCSMPAPAWSDATAEAADRIDALRGDRAKMIKVADDAHKSMVKVMTVTSKAFDAIHAFADEADEIRLREGK